MDGTRGAQTPQFSATNTNPANGAPSVPSTPPPALQESPEAKAERERLSARQREISVNLFEQSMQVETNFLNPNVWQQIRAMGRVFFDSKAIPESIANEAQLVMVLQAGFEAGMTPVESISSLYIVKGNINIYGKAVTRRFRNHGWKIEYKNESDAGCTAVVSKDGEVFEETYLYADAVKSGYTEAKNGDLKVGWREGINRKLKMRYGALSMILKSYLPDVLGNFADIKEVAEDAVIQEEPKKTIADAVISKTIAKEPIKPSALADRLAKKHDGQEGGSGDHAPTNNGGRAGAPVMVDVGPIVGEGGKGQ